VIECLSLASTLQHDYKSDADQIDQVLSDLASQRDEIDRVNSAFEMKNDEMEELAKDLEKLNLDDEVENQQKTSLQEALEFKKLDA
jgi:uncharacterized protein YukE